MDNFSQWSGGTQIDLSREPFGRPPKYRIEYANQAFNYFLLGATNEQVAQFLHISMRTFYYWQHTYPDFLQAVRSGKERADAEVARSMYHRALGMSIPDVHVSAYKGDVKITHLIKHIPPDVAAGKFWLTNRHPELWKSDPEPPPIDPSSNMPDEAVLDAMYDKSMERSRESAKVARGRRERLGLFTGGGDDGEIILEPLRPMGHGEADDANDELDSVDMHG